MRNRITRYEVALSRGTDSYLVAYTPRKSRAGLLDALRSRAERIVEITGSETFGIQDARTLTLDDGWVVRFTGRTQIDAQDHGELTFVMDPINEDEQQERDLAERRAAYVGR